MPEKWVLGQSPPFLNALCIFRLCKSILSLVDQGQTLSVLPLAFIQFIDCRFHHRQLRPQGIGAGVLPARDRDEVGDVWAEVSIHFKGIIDGHGIPGSELQQ